MEIASVEDWMKEIKAKSPSKKISDETLDSVIKNIYSEYLEPNNILLVNFTGYTPGFNDGDPCSHSSDFVMIEKFPDEVKTSADIKDFIAENDGTYAYEDSEATLFKSKSKQYSAVSLILSNFDERVLEFLYSTNYSFTVWKDFEGEIRYKYDDYDCGH